MYLEACLLLMTVRFSVTTHHILLFWTHSVQNHLCNRLVFLRESLCIFQANKTSLLLSKAVFFLLQHCFIRAFPWGLDNNKLYLIPLLSNTVITLPINVHLCNTILLLLDNEFVCHPNKVDPLRLRKRLSVCRFICLLVCLAWIR